MREKSLALCKSVLWGVCLLLFPILSGTLSAVLSLGTIETLLLQGIFMLLSLIIPLIFIRAGKWSWEEIGFAQIDAGGWKEALYFLPMAAILIPAAVKGFDIRSVPYMLGNLFLYFMVGVAEEVYFRGVIPRYLSRAFSGKTVIVFSTIVFGIGHIASAFTASSGSEVLLTVLNAFIFGWLAMEMATVCRNIVPGAALHFLFDFEGRTNFRFLLEFSAGVC